MFRIELTRIASRVIALLAVLLPVLGAAAHADEFSLRSQQSGRYVTIENGYLAAVAGSPAAARTWEMIRLDGDKVALRVPANGTFVRAGVGKGTFLAEGSGHIRGWETFELRRLRNGGVALRSVLNGKYVRAGVGNRSLLAAVSDRVGSWETFDLVTVGNQGPAAASLVGSWRLLQVAAQGGRLRDVRPDVAQRAWMTFERDGALSGRGGCNSFRATYRLEGDSLSVGRIVTTKMLCAGEAGEVEEDLYDGLPQIASFFASAGGNRITLVDRFHSPVAVLGRR